MYFWRNPDDEIRRAQRLVAQGDDPQHYLELLHRAADPRYYLEIKRLLGFQEFLNALGRDRRLDPAYSYEAPSVNIVNALLDEHNHTTLICHGLMYPGHCCFDYLVTRIASVGLPVRRKDDIVCALCQDTLATDGPEGPWIGGRFYQPTCIQSEDDIDDIF